MQIQNLFSSGTGIVISILLAIAIFLVFREIFTWYWKFTKMVQLLERIEENTRPKVASQSKVSEEAKDPPTFEKRIEKGFLGGEENT